MRTVIIHPNLGQTCVLIGNLRANGVARVGHERRAQRGQRVAAAADEAALIHHVICITFDPGLGVHPGHDYLEKGDLLIQRAGCAEFGEPNRAAAAGLVGVL